MKALKRQWGLIVGVLISNCVIGQVTINRSWIGSSGISTSMEKVYIRSTMGYPFRPTFSSQKVCISEQVFVQDIRTPLESRALANISISPNPTFSSFQVQCELSQINMTIYNLQGQVVLNTDLCTNQGVDISDLSKGVYMLYFFANGHYKSIKIVKL